MSTKKDRITKGLKEIGAAWAITSDRYVCADSNCCDTYNWPTPKMYHIHPDASHPHQDDIKPFENLDRIAEYIKARKAAASCGDDEEAFEIMQYFWNS